jgi:small subunit ribosomal protein S4e
VSSILTSTRDRQLSLSRITNIFVIGEGPKPWITLPKGKGIKLTIAEERDVKRKRAAESQ